MATTTIVEAAHRPRPGRRSLLRAWRGGLQGSEYTWAMAFTVPYIALFLAFVALLPSVMLAVWSINRYPFAGTSLLIAVGVALETMKQIDSQLMMRNYEGFLK